MLRVMVLLLCVCPACFAQTVKVRVLDGKVGRGLPKQSISVQFIYEKSAKVSTPLKLETDANGEAQFTIPEPAPAHLFVVAALTSEYWHCGCGFMGDTQTVVDKGILESFPTTAKPNTPLNPEPGHIVFVARPFTFFERLLYPLAKG